MRSAVWFVALILCICTVGASAQTAVPMTKAEFLASFGAPEPVLAKSGSLTKQLCTVHLTCDVGGYYLSCSSNNGDCHAGPTWVKCDGVQQNCPICYKSVDCGCDCGTEDCFGWSSCSSGARRVTCDGVTYQCPPLRQCCLY
jgi:hypothetical protein